jgi:SAM-dependent methyltransferase
VTDARTQLVADGYDVIGETFAEWRERGVGDPRRVWEDKLVARLADGARVLELGCGGGSPETKRLAQRFAVTGVDISPRQVERARAEVPGAEFVCADFTALELPEASFDAVASFYVFNHVPRELLAPLLGDIHRWLVADAGSTAGKAGGAQRSSRPPKAAGGGWLLTAFGQTDNPGWTGEWLGAPTFFSSFPPEINSRLVREAGFSIAEDEVVAWEGADDTAECFQWVLAQA